jgi:hypothetical protein
MKYLRNYIRNQILLESLKFDELGNLALFSERLKDGRTCYLLLGLKAIGFIEDQLAMMFEDYEEEMDETGDADWDDHECFEFAALELVRAHISDPSKGLVKAMMTVQPHGGSARNASEVTMSAAEPGWGPTLYDIAMSMEPNGLMADRQTVSDDAKSVWDFYHRNRSDVEKLPLDHPGLKFTPEPEDDTEWGGGGYHSSHLMDKGFRGVTREEYLDDTLNWVYRRGAIPSISNAIENSKALAEVTRDYADGDPNEMLGLVVSEIAIAYFWWRKEGKMP